MQYHVGPIDSSSIILSTKSAFVNSPSFYIKIVTQILIVPSCIVLLIEIWKCINVETEVLHIILYFHKFYRISVTGITIKR